MSELSQEEKKQLFLQRRREVLANAKEKEKTGECRTEKTCVRTRDVPVPGTFDFAWDDKYKYDWNSSRDDVHVKFKPPIVRVTIQHPYPGISSYKTTHVSNTVLTQMFTDLQKMVHMLKVEEN
eukprot:TRINITY_DN77598_c0_g1_i1.p1 TRINITY_DN77598_c0_g1~~TRINITY_DN77598_c0_g1_i1.p1  ORF type:complete len:123 (+),score=18.13 TRINITY_DN77598_c0_g1_i1:84-452(+)